MIPRYAVLSGRIRRDVADLGRVVDRVERALDLSRRQPPEREFLLDSVALNLHDFYTGLERILAHVASTLDQGAPGGPDWHRELLRQMTTEIPGYRPRVLQVETAASIEEFLRFRHVVRHVYAFQLEPERVERLAARLRPAFGDVRRDLWAFAASLDSLAEAE